MRYMLDTDMSSYIIRARPPQVLARFRQIPTDQLCLSVVTLAELLYGVERSSSTRINRAVVEQFVNKLLVLRWNRAAADHYAHIRTALEAAGTPIGAMDMMIAAHARSLGSIIVTNNVRHFSRVSDLTIENWAEETRNT